ncbi:hypothetical protein AGMMS50276_12490 [Synergistales bacterium]|nr:hypothetical protein AGMMS50276_12490 [Synergistales bacterium]
MAKHIGYHNALKLAKEALEFRDPESVASDAGVIWTGVDYEIPWLGRHVLLEEGEIDERIIWLHYLAANGPKRASGVYINYKQVPGAAIYNENFVKRTIKPMVKTFQDSPDEFLKLGCEMGGEPQKSGSASFTVRALPYIPLTCIIWQGDDEISANGNILFDSTAPLWFCAEDLVALAGMVVYKMLKLVAPKSTHYRLS